MSVLQKEGKIRAWGISEANEAYLRKAHAVCPVAAIQNRYSMLARWHEQLFPVLEELHIAYVAFSPLGNGFLSGKYDANTKFEQNTDFRSSMPQYTQEGYAKNRVLLAWMLHKKPFIIPIPGSRKPARLRENIGAAAIALTAAEVAEIDAEIKTMELRVFNGH